MSNVDQRKKKAWDTIRGAPVVDSVAHRIQVDKEMTKEVLAPIKTRAERRKGFDFMQNLIGEFKPSQTFKFPPSAMPPTSEGQITDEQFNPVPSLGSTTQPSNNSHIPCSSSSDPSISCNGKSAVEIWDTVLFSQSEPHVLEAVSHLRKVLSTSRLPDFSLFNEIGYLGQMVKLAGSYQWPSVQYEALWVLTNIAAGDSQYTLRLINCNILDTLLDCCAKSPEENIVQQAIWCMANICGDTNEARNKVINHRGFQACRAAFNNPEYGQKTKHITMWAMSNMVRFVDNQFPPRILCVATFPYFIQTLMNIELVQSTKQCIIDCMWGLTYIITPERYSLDFVYLIMNTPQVLQLVLNCCDFPGDYCVQCAGLRFIQAVSNYHPAVIEPMLNMGLIDVLKRTLRSSTKVTRPFVLGVYENLVRPHSPLPALTSGNVLTACDFGEDVERLIMEIGVGTNATCPINGPIDPINPTAYPLGTPPNVRYVDTTQTVGPLALPELISQKAFLLLASYLTRPEYEVKRLVVDIFGHVFRAASNDAIESLVNETSILNGLCSSLEMKDSRFLNRVLDILELVFNAGDALKMANGYSHNRFVYAAMRQFIEDALEDLEMSANVTISHKASRIRAMWFEQPEVEGEQHYTDNGFGGL